MYSDASISPKAGVLRQLADFVCIYTPLTSVYLRLTRAPLKVLDLGRLKPNVVAYLRKIRNYTVGLVFSYR